MYLSGCYLVVPVLNELAGLSKILPRLPKEIKVIVVDDGSVDGTRDLVSSFPNAYLIPRDGKRGLVSACIDGMKEALRHGAEYIAVMDGDGQHDPAELRKMLEEAGKGADLVLGSRYTQGARVEGLPWYRKEMSVVANRLFRLSFSASIRDATTGYRIYSRRAAQYLVNNPPKNSSYSGQVEIVASLLRIGMKVVECPIKFLARKSGKSKLNWLDVISYYFYVLLNGRLLGYTLAGISGLLFNEAMLYMLINYNFINYIADDIIAIEAGVAITFLLNYAWVFKAIGDRKLDPLKGFYSYNRASILSIIMNFSIFSLLWYKGYSPLLSNLAAVIISFIVSYMLMPQPFWVERAGP